MFKVRKMTVVSVMAGIVLALTGGTATADDSGFTKFEQRCLDGVMTVAHRGYGVGVRVGVTEDTIPAILKGMRKGTCMFETDYFTTRDGVPVSHHDPTLERMTNGFGRIDQRSWEYVRGLRSPTGARVPTFYQVQKATRRVSCFKQQEMKPGGVSKKIARKMVKINAKFVKAPECITIAASERSTLKMFNDLEPRYRTALIKRGPGRFALGTIPVFIDRINLELSAVTAKYVRLASKVGVAVSARGVNTVAAFRRMKRLGVKFIVTDRPEVVGSLR